MYMYNEIMKHCSKLLPTKQIQIHLTNNTNKLYTLSSQQYTTSPHCSYSSLSTKYHYYYPTTTNYISSRPITTNIVSTPPRVNNSDNKIIDLRSDTVTQPSSSMLQSVLNAPVGDDVLSEDPTVLRLQEYTADLFGKECALFVPTGTMGNLVSIIAHCYRERAAEIIIGSNSHICLWEGGNASNLASVHTRQIEEEANGTLNLSTLSNYIRPNHIDDDHLPKTTMIALENSHNMMGGSVFSYDYIDAVGELVAARSNISSSSSSSSSDGGSNLIKVHLDGARIGNASVALGVDFKRLCQNVDSISICLSKGLGAPLGSVVVGSKEFIQLAKRARKRLGGGMRQVGVVACMGLYALEHNIPRLVEDHERAKRIGKTLYNAGFIQPQNGDVDTNIVYFGLPNSSCLNDGTHAMEEEEENNNKKKKSKEEICSRLWKEYGVKIGSGYSSNNGGELFRMVTHLNVNDDDVDRALEAILKVCLD